MPKPEIKITNPDIVAQMPGPKPLSFEAAEEVDKVDECARAGSKYLAAGILLSFQAIIAFTALTKLTRCGPRFMTEQPPLYSATRTGQTARLQIVIIKLDRRDDAILLACAQSRGR